jgi:putative phosphoribosyl transferase
MNPGRKAKHDGIESEVTVEADEVTLGGTLALPDKAVGIVLFAHGSGSSRHSPRNRYVAQVLQSKGVGTLLFDLLTSEEESIDQYNMALRFDIPFLAKRLVGATEWILRRLDTKALKVGYLGASTGAAAALVAAAALPDTIAVVVSRGGRPDLAEYALGSVRAPTLLIVGGEDVPVIAMNQDALAKLRCPEKKLVIVPGATHLFEEPGTLEQVARLASEWFAAHFTPAVQARTQASTRD